MRDIRFRAWDKEAKEMFSPLSIRWDIFWGEESGAIILSPAMNDPKPKQLDEHMTYPVALKEEGGHYKEYDLMQYTGLKDKNGKEIYEGDIITGDMFGDEPEDLIKYIVEFGKGSHDAGTTGYEYQGFICRDIGEKGTEWWEAIDANGSMLFEDCEIIGNIHQHPGLLEDAKKKD